MCHRASGEQPSRLGPAAAGRGTALAAPPFALRRGRRATPCEWNMPAVAAAIGLDGAISASEIVPRGGDSWGSRAVVGSPRTQIRSAFLDLGPGSSPPLR